MDCVFLLAVTNLIYNQYYEKKNKQYKLNKELKIIVTLSSKLPKYPTSSFFEFSFFFIFLFLLSAVDSLKFHLLCGIGSGPFPFINYRDVNWSFEVFTSNINSALPFKTKLVAGLTWLHSPFSSKHSSSFDLLVFLSFLRLTFMNYTSLHCPGNVGGDDSLRKGTWSSICQQPNTKHYMYARSL